MLPPNNESVSKLTRETGISETTLYKWKNAAKAQGTERHTGSQSTDKWNTREKFAVVLETAALSEVELSEYCRAKGLFVEQVNAWRDACMNANGGVAEQAGKLQKDLQTKEQEIKNLSRELHRKEAALAETAARLLVGRFGKKNQQNMLVN